MTTQTARIQKGERAHQARKLRQEAAELDERGIHLTLTIATLDGQRMQYFARAERLRMQAEAMEER